MKKLLSLALIVCMMFALGAMAETKVVEGEAKGFGGPLKVQVTLEDGKITKVEILENAETVGIGTPALEQLPGLIVEAGSADVDGVSGATVTSGAIKEAVQIALGEKAAEEPAPVEPQPVPEADQYFGFGVVSSGRIGPAFEIYADERANRRVYKHVTMLAEGSTFATAFAPVSKLTFDPDLLIIMCDDAAQTERVLRATQWDTGDTIDARLTYVMGCNWIFTHPFVSGDINTVWTGICHGMTKHGAFPPLLPIVSIPWHHIDRVLRNMNEMPWTMAAHTNEAEEADRRGAERLGVEGII